MLSGVVKGAVFVVWWSAPTFIGYLIGFVVWGFGSSLASGTSESWLYDTLRGHAPRDVSAAFARIYGRGMIAASLGIATALAGGGYLAEFGYTVPLALSIAAPWTAAALVATAFREPPRSGTIRHDRFFATLSNGFSEVRGSRTLQRIVVMFAVLVTGYGVLDEFIGPFLAETGSFTLGSIGIAYAATYVMRTLGMELAHRLAANSLRAIALLFAASALALATTAVATSIVIVVALGGYFALNAAGEVLLQTRLQHEIAGSARATVTSLAKMSQHACEPLYLLYIGSIAQFGSFENAFLAVACSTLALAFGCVLIPLRQPVGAA